MKVFVNVKRNYLNGKSGRKKQNKYSLSKGSFKNYVGEGSLKILEKSNKRTKLVEKKSNKHFMGGGGVTKVAEKM